MCFEKCGYLVKDSQSAMEVFRRIFLGFIQIVPAIIGPAVASGESHTCAIDARGRLYARGGNRQGQLGMGDREPRYDFTLLAAFRNRRVAFVAAGSDHTIVVDFSGACFTFGSGIFGKLGHGDQYPRNIPTPVMALVKENIRVATCACGDSHTMVLDARGRLFGWGLGKSGEIGVPRQKENDTDVFLLPTFVRDVPCIGSIAAGQFHTLAIERGSRRVYSFGSNMFGQLGLGESTAAKNGVPKAIDRLSAAKVDGGFSHSICLDTHGDVYVWGTGNRGELGLADVTKVNLPTRVDRPEFTDSTPVHVGAGHFSSLIVLSDGSVLRFGTICPDMENGDASCFALPRRLSLARASEEGNDDDDDNEELVSYRIVALSLRNTHAALLSSNGELLTLGSDGVTNDDSRTDEGQPVAVVTVVDESR